MTAKTADNITFVYAGVAVSNALHLAQLWHMHGKSSSLTCVISLFFITTIALTVSLAVYESRGTKEVISNWIALSLKVLLLAEGITVEYIVTIWALVKEYGWKKRWGVVITGVSQIIMAIVLFAIRNLQGICAIPIISHCLSFALLFSGVLKMYLDKHNTSRNLRQGLWVAFSFVILAISIIFYAWGVSGRVDTLFPGQYFCILSWTVAGVYRQIRMRRME